MDKILGTHSIKKGENNEIVLVHISIYPLPPSLIMTTEKVTNPNNPSLLEEIMTYSCLNEVSEKSISRRRLF